MLNKSNKQYWSIKNGNYRKLHEYQVNLNSVFKRKA